MSAFRVNDGKLELAGIDEGREGCYLGARGLAFHPDGKTLFVACAVAGSLCVADRDATTGTTTVRQVLKNTAEENRGLDGAMGVAVSPDGQFAYVSSGRFHGDNAVSAYRLGSDGRLDFLQAVRDGEGALRNFAGGNQIAVSPDGRNVYAAATRSGTVAAFRRDRSTGKLDCLETIPDGGDEAGAGNALGAAGVGISPDGRFLYVATEDKSGLSLFRRIGGP